GVGLSSLVGRRLLREASGASPDLILVDQGDFLGASVVKALRGLNVPVINYAIDNPFAERDRRRFRGYLRALPHYDLVAVVREENVSQALDAGARRVVRVW